MFQLPKSKANIEGRAIFINYKQIFMKDQHFSSPGLADVRGQQFKLRKLPFQMQT